MKLGSCDMSSSSSSSSSSSPSIPFITPDNKIVYLPPPPPQPLWTTTARIAMYKRTPPRYLTHPAEADAEDALIKKRPGRPTATANTTLPNKKRVVMATNTTTAACTAPDPKSGSAESNLDPARLKRMVCNRISARKSRLRKQEYVESLKKAIIVEEEKIAELTPKVKDYENLNVFLMNENMMLRQNVQNLEMLKAEKEAEYTAMKKQINDLVSYLDLAATIHGGRD